MGPTVALALATAGAALPFHIAFTDGDCRRCEAQMLGAIQFSDGAVLWAQGYTPAWRGWRRGVDAPQLA